MMFTLVFSSNYYNEITCSDYWSTITLTINCQKWNKKKFSISSGDGCKNNNSKCIIWRGVCVCHCYSEYMMVNGHCVKENIPLNQSCDLNEQCIGSRYATCLDGICTCIEGYTATNSTECVLELQSHNQGGLSAAGANTGNNIGVTIGVLFGGLCLGISITAGIACIIFKRSKSSTGKREETHTVFADNIVYNVANLGKNAGEEVSKCTDVPHKIFTSYPCNSSKETPEYSHPKRQQTHDDVYNHLNEQDDRVDDDTYMYDHATAAIRHDRDLNDYSSVWDVEKTFAVSDDYSTLDKN
uniref:Uncharacterized protein LOC111106959 n=1 Tax=Crassostrea virginica TaxID=6565 RepID=A0A8B8B3D4_CRAVI|nr:uncharacterized protein LOC111106959 [Crassostrea virginica]